MQTVSSLFIADPVLLSLELPDGIVNPLLRCSGLHPVSKLLAGRSPRNGTLPCKSHTHHQSESLGLNTVQRAQLVQRFLQQLHLLTTESSKLCLSRHAVGQ